MPRTTLTFQLSGHQVQQDLVAEFARHDGVLTSTTDAEGIATIAVETGDLPAALWDVRATVGMFDDCAREIGQ